MFKVHNRHHGVKLLRLQNRNHHASHQIPVALFSTASTNPQAHQSSSQLQFQQQQNPKKTQNDQLSQHKQSSRSKQPLSQTKENPFDPTTSTNQKQHEKKTFRMTQPQHQSLDIPQTTQKTQSTSFSQTNSHPDQSKTPHALCQQQHSHKTKKHSKTSKDTPSKEKVRKASQHSFKSGKIPPPASFSSSIILDIVPNDPSALPPLHPTTHKQQLLHSTSRVTPQRDFSPLRATSSSEHSLHKLDTIDLDIDLSVAFEHTASNTTYPKKNNLNQHQTFKITRHLSHMFTRSHATYSTNTMEYPSWLINIRPYRSFQTKFMTTHFRQGVSHLYRQMNTLRAVLSHTIPAIPTISVKNILNTTKSAFLKQNSGDELGNTEFYDVKEIESEDCSLESDGKNTFIFNYNAYHNIPTRTPQNQSQQGNDHSNSMKHGVENYIDHGTSVVNETGISDEGTLVKQQEHENYLMNLIAELISYDHLITTIINKKLKNKQLHEFVNFETPYQQIYNQSIANNEPIVMLKYNDNYIGESLNTISIGIQTPFVGLFTQEAPHQKNLPTNTNSQKTNDGGGHCDRYLMYPMRQIFASLPLEDDIVQTGYSDEIYPPNPHNKQKNDVMNNYESNIRKSHYIDSLLVGLHAVHKGLQHIDRLVQNNLLTNVASSNVLMVLPNLHTFLYLTSYDKKLMNMLDTTNGGFSPYQDITNSILLKMYTMEKYYNTNINFFYNNSIYNEAQKKGFRPMDPKTKSPPTTDSDFMYNLPGELDRVHNQMHHKLIETEIDRQVYNELHARVTKCKTDNRLKNEGVIDSLQLHNNDVFYNKICNVYGHGDKMKNGDPFKQVSRFPTKLIDEKASVLVRDLVLTYNQSDANLFANRLITTSRPHTGKHIINLSTPGQQVMNHNTPTVPLKHHTTITPALYLLSNTDLIANTTPLNDCNIKNLDNIPAVNQYNHLVVDKLKIADSVDIINNKIVINHKYGKKQFHYQSLVNYINLRKSADVLFEIYQQYYSSPHSMNLESPLQPLYLSHSQFIHKTARDVSPSLSQLHFSPDTLASLVNKMYRFKQYNMAHYVENTADVLDQDQHGVAAFLNLSSKPQNSHATALEITKLPYMPSFALQFAHTDLVAISKRRCFDIMLANSQKSGQLNDSLMDSNTQGDNVSIYNINLSINPKTGKINKFKSFDLLISDLTLKLDHIAQHRIVFESFFDTYFNKYNKPSRVLLSSLRPYSQLSNIFHEIEQMNPTLFRASNTLQPDKMIRMKPLQSFSDSEDAEELFEFDSNGFRIDNNYDNSPSESNNNVYNPHGTFSSGFMLEHLHPTIKYTSNPPLDINDAIHTKLNNIKQTLLHNITTTNGSDTINLQNVKSFEEIEVLLNQTKFPHSQHVMSKSINSSVEKPSDGGFVNAVSSMKHANEPIQNDAEDWL